MTFESEFGQKALAASRTLPPPFPVIVLLRMVNASFEMSVGNSWEWFVN